MKILKPSLLLLLLLFTHTLYAATDYNSSRSNKSEDSGAIDNASTLIKTVSADALAVSRKLIEIDKRDGFEGEYLVTVEMSIKLQRCVKVATQTETVCEETQ